ncbi:hypothetical protein [Kitasatospora sp. HPMI-4]|uniref:hypothetical protein n=1 Tax=Kitasatospora sp. HPMI-4 TaxID=3448443 RepID=UPI003F1E1523
MTFWGDRTISGLVAMAIYTTARHFGQCADEMPVDRWATSPATRLRTFPETTKRWSSSTWPRPA